jgi:redox-sensitive bicupin YhaK (pirin superfamily)
MSIRPVKRLVKAKPTLEGAGVHLRRAFGFGNTSDFDPFLLLDDFRNDVPEDYLAGFPWHPHRGIETITYVLAGTVEHGDSMGNRGAIASGEVQWMTAGSGIIHQEMPKGDDAGRMHGFQLWANLPASNEDDGAALSGNKSARNSGDQRRRRHPCARRLRNLLGKDRAGGGNCHRSDLYRCVCFSRQKEDAPG